MPVLARSLLVLAAFLAVFPACSPEPEPQATPEPQEPASPAAAPAPAAPDTTPPPPVPETVSILRLMPESATAAVAFPSLASFSRDWLEILKRLAPDTALVDRWLENALRVGARELDTPGAASFAELLRAKGLDPDAPAGALIDTEPLQRAYSEARAALEARQASEGDGGLSGANGPIDIEATPRVAAVFRCSDVARAEQTARALVEAETVEPATIRGPPRTGVTIHVLNPKGMAYFLRDGWLVVGNSAELLAAIAARFDDPATVRYGTADAPALDPGEAVALVRADRLVPLMEGILPLVVLGRPGLAPWLELLYPVLHEAADAYTDDPLIVTLRRGPDSIDLVTRLDYGRHPRVQRLFGTPAPLRLAALLPSDTAGFLSMRITDETKETLGAAWFGDQARRFKDSQVRRSMEILRVLLRITGNNLALGTTRIAGGWARGIVIIELGDLETTRALLGTLGASEPVETYRGVAVTAIPLPLPVPLYYALSGDLLLLSNDRDAMRASLDLVASKGFSGFFTWLDPPFDPSRPRYNTLLLSDRFFRDVLQPLVSPPGVAPDDPWAAVAGKLAADVQQVRAYRTVEENWRVGRVSIYLREE